MFAECIFTLSVFGLMLVFVLNPLLTFIQSTVGHRRFAPQRECPALRVSVVIVVRNGADLIAQKIKNTLQLRYPDDFEVVVFSDGSTDDTKNMIAAMNMPRVRYLETATHEGKTNGLNATVPLCSGEIVVFTDVDALLDREAILSLVRHFADPAVGGVCGLRVIGEKQRDLFGRAQSTYISFDSFLKQMESRIGSLTSNDGKLYAIRKHLFHPIPPGVTDDFYTCLSVLRQGSRFHFEPAARCSIRMPSRNSRHEIQRRRRIVSRSLRAIFLLKTLLNPCSYGSLSLRLIINKVFRRLLPFFLLGLLVSSATLALDSRLYGVVLILQLAFYGLAILHATSLFGRCGLLTRLASTAFYFCTGMFGTLLGVLDFLRGKTPKKWEPVKA